MLAYFKDPAVQKSVESFNLAGRIMTSTESASLLKYKEGSWDYLHLNNSNMAGAKSNLFVSEKITKDTTVEAGGKLTTKLTVEYKNPFKGSDCGLESGGCVSMLLFETGYGYMFRREVRSLRVKAHNHQRTVSQSLWKRTRAWIKLCLKDF